MNIEELRAEFEAWVKLLPRGSRYSLITYVHEGQQYYDDTYTSVAFEAFQAGRATLQSQDREDAERYRVLRRALRPDGFTVLVNGYDLCTQKLDEAIDHARRNKDTP